MSVKRVTQQRQFQMRMSPVMFEELQRRSDSSGRSKAAEAELLMISGFSFDQMTGDDANVMVELFTAWKSGRARSIMEVLDKHCAWGELSTAILNVQLKHRREGEQA